MKALRCRRWACPDAIPRGPRAEALTNITDAIREYLAVVQELAQAATGAQQAEVEV